MIMAQSDMIRLSQILTGYSNNPSPCTTEPNKPMEHILRELSEPMLGKKKSNKHSQIVDPDKVKQILLVLEETPLEELDHILSEIICLAYTDASVRQFIVKRANDLGFYCQTRSLVESLAPHDSCPQFETDIDSSFVNNCDLNKEIKEMEEEYHKAMSLTKDRRSTLIQLRHQFFNSLSTLSSELKELKDLELEGGSLFKNSLSRINEFLLRIDEKQEEPILINFRHKMQLIKLIDHSRSSFLKTKNRAPLILDFGFSRFIFKNDDQLQNEIVASQISKFLARILDFVPIVTFEVTPVPYGALYQFVQNAQTISDIKKKCGGSFKKAILESGEDVLQNFTKSLAGFAIQQYVLMLKDRHNQNIMLTRSGYLFHIDLAFIFNSKVGWGFQSAPFKLTKEYAEIMGGAGSDRFMYFQSLLTKCFINLFKNLDMLVTKLRVLASNPHLPCFQKFSIQDYLKRFPQKQSDIVSFTEKLVANSYDNWRTKKYDSYQTKNGIMQ